MQVCFRNRLDTFVKFIDFEMGKNTGRRDAKRRSLVKKEGRRDVNASRKYKERFLLSSTVVIRAECIVDIDLPCRTEPACSFPQHSFIILAGQDSHLLHTSPSLLLSLSLSQRSSTGTEASPERTLFQNWLLGYGSMMLQPAASLLNDDDVVPLNCVPLTLGHVTVSPGAHWT